MNYANAIASLSIALGHDASKFDPDEPLPENIPESNASKSGRERAIALGQRENLTVRQLAQRLGGYSRPCHGRHAGKTIADEMEEWLATEASDGFTMHVPLSARRLDDFCRPASCRNCSGAACSAANTRARRCAKIWDCRARRTGSFRIENALAGFRKFFTTVQ